MSETPGPISTFFAIIGILGYLIADLFTITFIQNYLNNPITFDNFWEQIIGTFFVIAFTLVFTVSATVAVLLGQIWRQRRIIVLISTLSYGVVFVFFGWLSYDAIDPITFELVLFWIFLVTIMAIHVKGLFSSN